MKKSCYYHNPSVIEGLLSCSVGETTAVTNDIAQLLSQNKLSPRPKTIRDPNLINSYAFLNQPQAHQVALVHNLKIRLNRAVEKHVAVVLSGVN